MGIAAVLSLLNLAIPAGFQIYTLIHDQATGTTTLIVSLNAADTANPQTLSAIAAWQQGHPAPATPPPVPQA